MRLLFPLILFFCAACTQTQILTEDRRFTMIVSNEGDKIADELQIYPFGFGVKGPDGIQGITLSYSSRQRVNVEQARELIVRLAQQVLLRVNQKISSENLNREPVDLSFFYLCINFHGIETSHNENEDELAMVVISKSIVEYDISKPGVRRLIPIHSEPYTEAYQIVFGNS